MTRVAAIQYKARKGQRVQSQKELAALIEEAARAGAALIVCPEMACSGYLFASPDDLRPLGELCQRDSLGFFGAIAQQYGVYLVIGYPEWHMTHDGRVIFFNSARVIDNQGRLAYNYRKRLLYDADETWATPGDTPYPLLQTAFGTLTVGICMDLNDDRFVQFLQQARPDHIAFCTNWLDQGEDVLPYWLYRLHGVTGSFVAANTYGHETSPIHPLTRFCGGSAILSLQAEGPALLHARGQHMGDEILLADL
jgi:predicted amidohydrolase